MTAASPPADGPRWSWDDLALFIGGVLPSLAIAALSTKGLKALFPATFGVRAVEAFFLQTVFYLCSLAALYFIVRVKHGTPFFESLGWRRPPSVGWPVAIGIALMFTTGLLGLLLKAPLVSNPLQEMLTGSSTRVVVILFVAILGPFWEELVFRGFLYSLFARFFGPWPAIAVAAVPFGLIHGPQNEWVWQYLVIFVVVGLVFGWVRYRTASTVAATLTHSVYNSAQLVIFLLQGN